MNLESTDRNTFKQLFRQRCFNFSIKILHLSKNLYKNEINTPLINQLIRSATSIGANITEGGSGSSKKEFINFFQIALKSAIESIYWLALLKEMNLGYSEKFTSLISENIEIKKLISTIIINTKERVKLRNY